MMEVEFLGLKDQNILNIHCPCIFSYHNNGIFSSLNNVYEFCLRLSHPDIPNLCYPCIFSSFNNVYSIIENYMCPILCEPQVVKDTDRHQIQVRLNEEVAMEDDGPIHISLRASHSRV